MREIIKDSQALLLRDGLHIHPRRGISSSSMRFRAAADGMIKDGTETQYLPVTEPDIMGNYQH
jgi:hypothetical protein